jgi:hypothetical protein
MELYKTKPMPDGKELRIYRDENPENPRIAWDGNMGIMVCYHSMYNLGDKDAKNLSECNPLAKLPLYLYDHSGITIRTTPFHCGWDSGHVGWIYTTEDRLTELGIEEHDPDKLKEMLRQEVETYDQYLTGDVFGFEVVEFETCNLNHVHEKEVNSCWGYFGVDFAKNGLFDAAGYGVEA